MHTSSEIAPESGLRVPPTCDARQHPKHFRVSLGQDPVSWLHAMTAGRVWLIDSHLVVSDGWIEATFKLFLEVSGCGA